MATIKFLNASGKYADDLALQNVISYILQPRKTPSRIVGCTDGEPQFMPQKMATVSAVFNKYSKVRLRHFVIAFMPYETTDRVILSRIAKTVCQAIGSEYQTVFALHEDTANLHIHFVFNAVSYVTGKRYRGDKRAHYMLIDSIKAILHSFGLFQVFEVKYYPAINNPHE